MIGRSMKRLHSHGLQLTIKGVNRPTIQAPVVLVGPRVRGHVARPHGHKTKARRGEKGVRVRVRNITFVAKDGSALGQTHSQFMNRRQILLGSRPQVKTQRNTVRGTKQVQAPAEELFVLGGAIATKGFATYLLAARGPRSFAPRQRHTVDDKGFSLGIDFCYQADDPIQPLWQRVPASVKARHAQPTYVAQAY